MLLSWKHIKSNQPLFWCLNYLYIFLPGIWLGLLLLTPQRSGSSLPIQAGIFGWNVLIVKELICAESPAVIIHAFVHPPFFLWCFFIIPFTHSSSKHWPDAWRNARCCGHKDEFKTCSLSWRSSRVIGETDAGRGDRAIAAPRESTNGEGHRGLWEPLGGCPLPAGAARKTDAQSLFQRIFKCPTIGNSSNTLWYWFLADKGRLCIHAK